MPQYINWSNIPHNIDKLREFENFYSDYVIQDGQRVFINRPVFPEAGETDGYKEHFTTDSTQVVRVFDIPWDERLDFINTTLGWSAVRLVSPGASVYRLHRQSPVQHPEMPFLYAQEIELVGGMGYLARSEYAFALLGTPDPFTGKDQIDANQPLNMVAYRKTVSNQNQNRNGYARYAVHFRPVTYEIRTDEEIVEEFESDELARYVTRSFAYSTSTVPYPVANARLVFTEGPNRLGAIPENFATLILPRVQLRYKWHMVPDIPLGISLIAPDSRRIVGRVNADEFDGIGPYPLFPEETLLCQPPVIERHRSPTGRVYWDVDYLFTYQPEGWNRFPDVSVLGSGAYFRAGIAGDPTKTVYQRADFDPLFQLPRPPRSYQ